MNFSSKIKHYYPLILILQIPLIAGFILPFLLYNDFFYSELKMDDIVVQSAINYYLIIIIFTNLLSLIFLYFFQIKFQNHFRYLNINWFVIAFICFISLLCTILSKLYYFNNYYFNLLFYIGQHAGLIIFSIATSYNNNKIKIIFILVTVILCNLICLYTGDSKFFLVSILIIFIITYYKLSLKNFLILIILSSILSFAVLGFKKIYRDYMHLGGMDKLNYQFNEDNTTYTEKFNYSGTKDFLLKQKLDFLVYNKSYLYSDVCSNGYKFKNRIIEYLISHLVFEDGVFRKENLNLHFLNNFPEIKEFIEYKTNTSCYLFFRFVHRIDFLTPLAQVINEVDDSNFVNGKTYSTIIYTFIPRFIFKNKPKDNADEVYMKLMDNLKSTNDKNRTIISVSLITEAWINYLELGIYFITIISALFIFFTSIFYFSNNIYLRILSSSVIIHFLNFNLSLKQIISGSYQLFIVFTILFLLINILTKMYTKRFKL